MNWDQIKGKWQQMTGEIQSEWGELTNDEVAQIDGDREKLEGLIRERYGKTKEEVHDEVEKWLKKAA